MSMETVRIDGQHKGLDRPILGRTSAGLVSDWSRRGPIRGSKQSCPSLLFVFPFLFLFLFSPYRPIDSSGFLRLHTAIMPYHAVVMYPNDDDIHFDRQYYMSVHMPLVESTWKKHGLVSWQVVEYSKALDDAKPAYLIAAKLEWESEEALENALKDPEGAKIFADIPNFTNKQPLTMAGNSL